MAGALTGLGSGAARADEPPAGAPGEGCRVEPTPAQRVAAEAMFDEAQRELEAGRRASAAQLAMHVHTLMKRPKTALLAARLLHEGGDFLAALVIEDQLACTGPDPELSELLARVETEHGAVRVEVTGALDWSLEIDQRPVAAQHRTRKLRLPPGKHQILVNSPSSPQHKQEIEILAGTDTAITVSLLPPLPCLSPHRRRREDTLVEIGIAAISPMLALTTERRISGGGGLRMSVAGQPLPDGWFTGDIFGTLAGGEHQLLHVGTFADVRYHVLPWFALGLGVSAGAQIEFIETESFVTPFWGPFVVPAAFAHEAYRLDLRIPCWFDATPDRGPALIAPQVVLGVTLPVARRHD